MRRATTPTFLFKLPEAASEYAGFKITFAQNGVNLFSVGTEETINVDIDGNTVSYTLSQQQANMFQAGELGQVQLRAWKSAASVQATRPFTFEVGWALDDSIVGV